MNKHQLQKLFSTDNSSWANSRLPSTLLSSLPRSRRNNPGVFFNDIFQTNLFPFSISYFASKDMGEENSPIICILRSLAGFNRTYLEESVHKTSARGGGSLLMIFPQLLCRRTLSRTDIEIFSLNDYS